MGYFLAFLDYSNRIIPSSPFLSFGVKFWVRLSKSFAFVMMESFGAQLGWFGKRNCRVWLSESVDHVLQWENRQTEVLRENNQLKYLDKQTIGQTEVWPKNKIRNCHLKKKQQFKYKHNMACCKGDHRPCLRRKKHCSRTWTLIGKTCSVNDRQTSHSITFNF